MPWATKIKYKFIVDGRWMCQPGAPEETDLGGFVNNVYYTPPRPIATPQPIGEVLANSDPALVPSASSERLDASSQTEQQETTESKSGEPSSVAAPSEGVRLPIPIIPVNAAEHNTILSTPPLAPVPDYVLPPSPRARSTSPSAQGRRPYPTPAPAPAQEAPEPEQARLPIPIIPVNAAEHNTILTTPPPPPVPDYVLPPSPRARSTSPSSEDRRPYPTAASLPEPEPLNLHEVEVSPEASVAVAPEVPVEEKKQEAEAVIPIDCAAPAHLSPKPEDPVVTQEEKIIAPSEILAAKPEEKEEKEQEASTPVPSALPTPPATPKTKDTNSFPTLSQSPSPTASPSSSRFGTGKSRKKRQSIFGKIKDIFSSDKDKEKKGKSPLKT